MVTERPSIADMTEMAGRDDAVAVEERGAEDTEQHHQPEPPAAGPDCRAGQGRQGHDAPLAVVVGPQDEDDVLHRHHER